MLRSITENPIRMRVFFWSVIALAITLLSTFIIVRSFMMRQMMIEQGALREKVETLISDQKHQTAAIRDELDAIERTLYSGPTPPPPERRSSYVEQWMINRNKEIQDRLRALEQWRYRTER